MAPKTVEMGIVIGRSPGLVWYTAQTDALTSDHVCMACVHRAALMLFGAEDFLMVAACLGEASIEEVSRRRTA